MNSPIIHDSECKVACISETSVSESTSAIADSELLTSQDSGLANLAQVNLSNTQLAHDIILYEMSLKIPEWREAFLNLYGWRVEIVLEGSFKIGNFVGSKKSFNPDNEKSVIDVDISIRLPKNLNSADPLVIEAIENVTKSHLYQNFTWDYWGVNINAGVYFRHENIKALEELVGTSLVELEFVVRCRGEGVAFSDYWERIFTHEEIKQQTLEKNQASKLGVEEYKKVKAQHDVDARWRIMAGWYYGILDGMPKKLTEALANWAVWAQTGTENKWDGVSENIMPRKPNANSHRWVVIAWEKARQFIAK